VDTNRASSRKEKKGRGKKNKRGGRGKGEFSVLSNFIFSLIWGRKRERRGLR